MVTTKLDKPKRRPGQGPDGKFLAGNKLAKGNPLAGSMEQLRFVLLDAAKERLPAVINKVFDLAEQGERWACELVLDRSLGKQRELPDPVETVQPTNLTQINLDARDLTEARKEDMAAWLKMAEPAVIEEVEAS